MSRTSIFSRNRIPIIQARFVIPSQLDADLSIVSRITGWNKGELVTLATLRLLRYMIPAWNERYTLKIPPLPSIALHDKTFRVRDLMETLETMSKRRQSFYREAEQGSIFKKSVGG